MSEKLEYLQEKYGQTAAKHEPNPDCPYCKGAGEKFIESRFDFVPSQWSFCPCVFFLPEDIWIADELGKFASKELRRLRGEE